MELELICRTCGKEIKNKPDAIIAWREYDGNDVPIEPVILHKNIVESCDYKNRWPFFYGVDAFLEKYPGVKIIQ